MMPYYPTESAGWVWVGPDWAAVVLIGLVVVGVVLAVSREL